MEINIFRFIAILTVISFASCDKDQPEEPKDCRSTVVYLDSGYDLQLKSTIEYYDESGYIVRSENDYYHSDNEYYETYEYDKDYKITTFFRSYEGYLKYSYNGELIVKKEIFDLDMNLIIYHSFEYFKKEIIHQYKYSPEGILDTTINYYYSNGLLDSAVTKKIRVILPEYYSKTEYKYDSNGNNTELIHYSNSQTENVEIISKHKYVFDNNSNMVQYEFRN